KIKQIGISLGIIAVLIFLKSTMAQCQTSLTGVATYFDGLGTPYGACGVPTNLVESENFVALNVYNSPGVGTMWPRPLRNADTVFMGEYQNGRNCGRWIKVTMQEDCIGGINDGALGQAFCRNGGIWTNDVFSTSTLYMIVTDACGDNNGWCRDSRYHLDLHKPSLANFQKNGTTLPNMFPTNWNNRKITWEYTKSPNYTGDIDIYFMQNAQNYWPAIMINHLENGIHWVEQKVGNQWVKVPMNSDMGQSYILNPGPCPYTIRIADASGKYIQNSREYTFCNPCGSPCTPPTTKVTYTTYNPSVLSIPDIQLHMLEVGDEWSIRWKSEDKSLNETYVLEYSNDGTNFVAYTNPVKVGANEHQAQLSAFQAQWVRLVKWDSNNHTTFGKIYPLSKYKDPSLLTKKSNTSWQINNRNDQPVTVHIWNMEGKIMWESTFDQSTVFQIPAMPKGLYMIRASSEMNYFSDKFVTSSAD
ncbi:MAG: T9SS type A sorting domain-containing protein, partial [Cytophagales bacterium]|nr:T9SS type A sorting domain-containing protein [Cytophagales bacterium]